MLRRILKFLSLSPPFSPPSLSEVHEMYRDLKSWHHCIWWKTFKSSLRKTWSWLERSLKSVWMNWKILDALKITHVSILVWCCWSRCQFCHITILWYHKMIYFCVTILAHKAYPLSHLWSLCHILCLQRKYVTLSEWSSLHRAGDFQMKDNSFNFFTGNVTSSPYVKTSYMV